MNYQFLKIPTMTAAFEEVPYDIKTALKSVGWVVKASGDGLSAYSSTTDIITSMTSGANGWLNARAWFRIQSPSGNEEYTFQRTAATTVRAKISHFAKFTGGSPSATVTPSAADEAILLGGGTDASPTSFSASGLTGYRHYIGMDADAPYSWYSLVIFPGGYTSGTASAIPYFMAQDGLSQIEPTDASQIFTMMCGSASLLQTSFATASSYTLSSSGAYLCARYPSTNTTSVLPIGWNMVGLNASSTAMAGNCSGNIITLKEELLPFGLWRSTSLVSPAFKGLAATFRLLGANKAPGDTLSVNSTRDKIIIGQFVFPWDGSVPVV